MKRVIKIADNDVEVQTVYFDDRIDGKEVIINRKSYGQNRIDREKMIAQKEFSYWDTVTQKEIDRKKTEFQTELDELDLIQQKMDGEENARNSRSVNS